MTPYLRESNKTAHNFVNMLFSFIFCMPGKFNLVNYNMVEPRFNKVPRDWANPFLISTVCCIKNLVLTNLLENNQSVRYIGL